jgi:photosystem II stability/assembly factor-like uncharacterized protein
MTAVRGASALSGVLAVSLALLSAACERNPHEPLEPLTPPPPGWATFGLQGSWVVEMRVHENVLYAGTRRGVFRRNLAGVDTAWHAIGLADRRIYALLPLSRDELLAAVEISGEKGDTISIFRTTDGGRRWNAYQNGFGGGTEAKEVRSLARLPDGSLLAGGRAWVIAKSTDGGRSWQKVDGDWDAGAMGVHFVEPDPRAKGVVWAGGEGGRFQPFIFKSEDSGESWRRVYQHPGGDNAHYSLAADPTDSKTLYSGMEGYIVKTVDGGNSWQTILGRIAPYFFGLVLSPTDPTRIYAAGAEQTAEQFPISQAIQLYVSRDGGSTWSIVSSGVSADHGVWKLLLIEHGDTEALYLGTGEGVYRYVPAS